MTYQQQPCNHTSHCELCSPGMRNYERAHIGDEHSTTPRIAVCPRHDIAGPVGALPVVLRRVVTP